MGKQMLRKSVLGMLLVMGGMMVALPAVAQNTLWRIDSEHSTARLFLASSKNPDAGDNVGVARTRGVIDHEVGDPSRSDFDFTIYPADKPADESGKNPDYTVIRFKSTRVVPVNEETFRVTGDLTLSYVERSVTADPSEAYSGPSFRDPGSGFRVPQAESCRNSESNRQHSGMARVEHHHWGGLSSTPQCSFHYQLANLRSR